MTKRESYATPNEAAADFAFGVTTLPRMLTMLSAAFSLVSWV